MCWASDLSYDRRNHVGRGRLTILMEPTGSTRHHDHERETTTSSDSLGGLAALPDVSGGELPEHDGHTDALYEICVAVESVAHITFAFEGTSPQAPGFINCHDVGTAGCGYGPLLPILAPDIAGNEGCCGRSPSRAGGSLCNAIIPAPTSGARVSAACGGARTSAVAALRGS